MIIESNTFAEACYNMNSAEELEQGLRGDADEADMDAWGITAEEWRDQIVVALAAKRADDE